MLTSATMEYDNASVQTFLFEVKPTNNLGAKVGFENASDKPDIGAKEVPASVGWTYHGVIRCLWVFGGPLIFCIGLVGNVLILLVMTRRRMRGTSTCVYLTLMAIADTMVLVTGLIPEVLEASSKRLIFKELHPATCKLEKFFFYTSADTAVWILVLFTFDRFIAVCFPLKKSYFCLSSTAKIYSLIALLAAVAKNGHVAWTRGAQFQFSSSSNSSVLKSNCGKPSAQFEYFENFVRPWIAFTLVSLLPFLTIILCNLFIINALLAVRRMRAEHSNVVSTSDKSLVQMTAMCLSASICFLVCITPSIILLIVKPYWATAPAYQVAKVINNELVYVNHSVNFFLYCVTGKRFRSAILSFFHRRKKPSARSFEFTNSESLQDSRAAIAYRMNISPDRKRMSRCADDTLLVRRNENTLTTSDNKERSKSLPFTHNLIIKNRSMQQFESCL